ncbi:MAG: hypothetical protein ACR2P0_05200 [Acidimicrobiales bacterium]
MTASRSALLDQHVTRRTVMIVVGAVVVWRMLMWFLVMRHVPLVGDEDYFVDRSRFIIRVLERRTNGNELQGIVNRAWWMPGPMILVTPIRWLTREIDMVRLWLGTVDLALLLVAGWLAARRFGAAIGLAFIAIVGIFPDAAAQSFAVWGEAIGSKLLVIMLLIVLGAVLDENATFGHMALAGLLLGIAVYFRPPLVLQLAAVAAMAMVAIHGRADRGRGTASAAIVGAGVFIAMGLIVIAPWSVAASRENDALVLTTLSIDANAIHAFSNPSDLDAAAGGTGFRDIERYAQERQVSDDLGYADALRTIRREQLDLVSFDDYWQRADREVETFLDGSLTFLHQYRDLRADSGESTTAHTALIVLHTVLWYVLILAVVWVMLRPFPVHADASSLFVSFLGRGSLALLAIQPFVSNAKFRHLGLAIPLMVLLVLVAAQLTAREPTDAPEMRRWSRVVIGVAQTLGVAGTVMMAVVYLN